MKLTKLVGIWLSLTIGTMRIGPGQDEQALASPKQCLTKHEEDLG